MIRLILSLALINSFSLLGQSHVVEFLGEIEGEVSEVSGIVQVPSGEYFVLGDSGNENAIYEITQTGDVIRKITLVSTTNIDWEELQLDDQGNLYIGDIGNNLSFRDNLVIYKVPHFTDSLHLDEISFTEEIFFSYSDQTDFTPNGQGAFDAEAFIILNNEIHLFSKDHGNSGSTKQYTFPSSSGTHSAELQNIFSFNSWLTGCTYDRGKDIIYFTTVDGIEVFHDYSIHNLDSPSCFISNALLQGKQIESLWFNLNHELIVAEDVEGFGQFSKLYRVLESCSDQAQAVCYPNPFDEVFSVVSESIFYELYLYDSEGAELHHTTLTSGAKKMDIDTSNLPAGQYVLKVFFSKESQTIQLIKTFD